MIVGANKIDALDEPDRLERLRRHLQQAAVPLYAVSAATGDGVPALLEAMWTAVSARPSTEVSSKA
jgi:GTPase